MAKKERRFVYLLSVAHRRVHGSVHTEKGGATAAQAGVLFLLGAMAKTGALVGDVARALGVGLAGASGLVDRMVDAGLVERRPDEHDGRSWRLFLTKRGAAMRGVALTTAADMNARMVDGFTESELDVVARWLTQVARRFGKEDET